MRLEVREVEKKEKVGAMTDYVQLTLSLRTLYAIIIYYVQFLDTCSRKSELTIRSAGYSMCVVTKLQTISVVITG
jgi:hypothetical protein